MRSVDIVPKEMEALARDAQSDTPIVMLNLLRYRGQAEYPADFEAAACTGREAYGRYGELVMPLIGNYGGRPIWMGHVTDALIAPQGEAWDDAVLVQYPSRRRFLDMILSAEYQAAKPHRTAGLEDSRLIESTTAFGLGSE